MHGESGRAAALLRSARSDGPPLPLFPSLSLSLLLPQVRRGGVLVWILFRVERASSMAHAEWWREAATEGNQGICARVVETVGVYVQLCIDGG